MLTSVLRELTLELALERMRLCIMSCGARVRSAAKRGRSTPVNGSLKVVFSYIQLELFSALLSAL